MSMYHAPKKEGGHFALPGGDRDHGKFANTACHPEGMTNFGSAGYDWRRVSCKECLKKRSQYDIKKDDKSK